VTFIDNRLAAAACDVPLYDAVPLLDGLVEANLVEQIGPARFRFHDLVRLHAAQLGEAEETAPAQQATLRRVHDLYLATATAADARLSPSHHGTLPRAYEYEPDLDDLHLPFDNEADTLAWLDAHRPNLMAMLRATADRGWDDAVWQLADAMWSLFHRLRYVDDWIAAHELGRDAARRAGNRSAERQMLNSGAIGLGAAGRYDEEIDWYTQSLASARKDGARRDEGQALLGLGATHRDAERPSEAEQHLKLAIAVWKECGYRRGVGLALITLGQIALDARESRRAVEHFARARNALLAPSVNDPYNAHCALAFLGRAEARAGHREAGTTHLGDALAYFESLGAAGSYWQARIWEMLGATAEEHGDSGEARHCYERALALFEPSAHADARRVAARLGDRPIP
jgi:tetratricopeptide (TPR) repeat protein